MFWLELLDSKSGRMRKRGAVWMILRLASETRADGFNWIRYVVGSVRVEEDISKFVPEACSLS